MAPTYVIESPCGSVCGSHPHHLPSLSLCGNVSLALWLLQYTTLLGLAISLPFPGPPLMTCRRLEPLHLLQNAIAGVPLRLQSPVVGQLKELDEQRVLGPMRTTRERASQSLIKCGPEWEPWRRQS